RLCYVSSDGFSRRYFAVAFLQQLDGIVPVSAVAAVGGFCWLSDEFTTVIIGDPPVRRLLDLACFSVAPCGLVDASGPLSSLHLSALLLLREAAVPRRISSAIETPSSSAR